MADATDILIIGGGIIGLTSALRLRECGAEVTLCDRGEFGREASWAGAGIIPPGRFDKAATSIDRLRAFGSEEFPRFSNELRDRTGIDNGYRRNGGIEFLTPEDAYAVGLWDAEGIHHVRLDDRRVPRATAHWLPDMAQVRNPWHLRALTARVRQVGVTLLPHIGVENWLTEHGRVKGARLTNGDEIQANQFLVSAGPWSERLLAALNCRPGIHPIRGQILLLTVGANPLEPTLLVGKRYLVPRGDGRVLVGSTEEPEAGFAKQTTPGALGELRDFACGLVPELARAEIEASWAGLRPGSPDGLPMIGPVPGYANVFTASGHSRAGVQLSLGTARLIAELMMGRTPFVPTDSFKPERQPVAPVKPAFRS